MVSANAQPVRGAARLAVVGDARPSRTAVVLLNVGTPDEPTTGAVRRYLREFLSDPRVLDMPAPLRFLILNLFILPFRPAKSAAAYRKVWTPEGSPLMVHSKALERALQERMPRAKVMTAMRYGNPSIRAVVEEIAREGIDHVVLVPLYPQHASASTGSAVQRAFQLLGALPRVPNVSVVPEMFDDAGFLDGVTARFSETTAGLSYDHVLFSYHGLPLGQVQKVVRAGHTCGGVEGAKCCDALTADNASCYRAQSLATTRLLVRALGVGAHSTSFQSRLGRAQWLLPNTEDELARLRNNGVKRLVVVTPSFTADCLETLEEIGVRAKEQWTSTGGESLVVVPCVNAHPAWVEGLARLIERTAPAHAAG
jgi:protoporphyrin/coproporphyrin ferrochelatase